MSRERPTVLLVGVFLVGLAVRLAFLNKSGTTDVDIDLQWGRDANQVGLPLSYHGNYFPLQYQVFQIAAAAPSVLPISALVAFKAINLGAEIGTFLLLILLLKRWRLTPLYAALYWLHPYFLAMFWLGYVDSQFGFLVVLGIFALTRAESLRDYAIAGVPFAAAWLTKPQPLIGILMIALFCAALVIEFRAKGDRLCLNRVGRLAALFIAPVVFYGAYAVWFALETRSLTRFFTKSYSGTADFMPVLTAQMLNIWNPVAEHYRTTAQAIWQVRGPDSLHVLAQIGTLACLIGATYVIWRFARSRTDALVVLYLVGIGAAILPMTMTRAHENHFFLAATLLVPMCAILRSATLNALVIGFLGIQFVNLFGLYRFGNNDLSEWSWIGRVDDWYSIGVQQLLAFVSVAVFLGMAGFICHGLWRNPTVDDRQEPDTKRAAPTELKADLVRTS